MTHNNVIDQHFQSVQILGRGKVLKGADADVTFCNADQNTARQALFAVNSVASSDRGERATGGNAECSHCFADQVFPQYGP